MANISIFIILNDFYLSSAYFCYLMLCYVIANVRNLESYIHIALENCQWSGEPYSAGAAISIDGFLPQIPFAGA
jgi:hypothetical protein